MPWLRPVTRLRRRARLADSSMDQGMAPDCDIGARFRSADRTIFGHQAQVWEVIATFQAIYALRYAQLVHVQDRTRTKTVATEALLDTRLHAPAWPTGQTAAPPGPAQRP